MTAPVDPVELRRLAEAAHTPRRHGWGWDMARCVDQYQPDDQVRIYFDLPEVDYLAAVSPDVVLALLDERQALLDRIDGLDEAYETVVATNRQLIRQRDEARARLAVPGAVAGEPESEGTP